MRIRAAADLYLADLEGRRVSGSLARQARHSLNRLVSHLSEGRVRELSAVDPGCLAGFARTLREAASRRGSPLSVTSQAIYLQRLRSFFRFLEQRGLVLRSAATDLRVPTCSTLPRSILTERQARRLMDAPAASTRVGLRDRAILETFYGTALRRGECCRLDVSDLDFGEGTLLVRDGKGHKDRLLPLPGRAAAALRVYLSEVRTQLVRDPTEPALFLTAWWGQRLSDVSLALLVRRYASLAGIEGLHPHALRHTCATHLLKGGADVRHVQAILGHKKLDTTALYTRVVIDDLREVLARAHPRERRRRRRQTR